MHCLDHLLFMTLYLVTVVTDHHLTCLKMRARDKRTATKNFRCSNFIVQEKHQKKLRGGWQSPSPLLVRPRVKIFIHFRRHCLTYLTCKSAQILRARLFGDKSVKSANIIWSITILPSTVHARLAPQLSLTEQRSCHLRVFHLCSKFLSI